METKTRRQRTADTSTYLAFVRILFRSIDRSNASNDHALILGVASRLDMAVLNLTAIFFGERIPRLETFRRMLAASDLSETQISLGMAIHRNHRRIRNRRSRAPRPPR